MLNGRRRAGRGVRALALRGKQERTMIKRKSKEKRADGEPATAESASAAEWRRFAEVARELAEMPAPSWARLRNASLLLTTGASAELKAAEENGGAVERLTGGARSPRILAGTGGAFDVAGIFAG